MAAFALALLFVGGTLAAAALCSDACWVVALGSGAAALCLVALALREVLRSGGGLRGRGLAEAGLTLSLVWPVLGFLFLGVANHVRVAAARAETGRRCQEITQAMHRYAEDHGRRFPPAALRDGEGKTLLSWRVLLLPYLGHEDLYRQFRLDEPWDGAHNLALLPRMPAAYWRPSRGDEPGTTPFRVFVGPGTAFEGPHGLRFPKDFPDGLSTTVLVAEARDAVPWTKPEELNYAPDESLPPLGSEEPSGFPRFLSPRRWRHTGTTLGLGDGSARYYWVEQLREVTLRRAITRNDGEAMGDDW